MELLELQDVTRTFGGVKAVDDVSFSLAEGHITSLIGPNGAGKTTLFGLITGFLKPDAGVISYRGRRIDGLPPYRIAGMGIGRLFQDVRVFDRLTVLDNVLLARKGQRGENPVISLLFRRRVQKEEAKNLEVARSWLDFVGLGEMENALAEDLSYGQQKLLAIARLLANDADLLLLDEPTAGVNPGMVRSILDLIRRLTAEGKTVVVIEHNMSVIMEISNWVFFLDDGKLISFGLPEEILGDPAVREAYIGI